MVVAEQIWREAELRGEVERLREILKEISEDIGDDAPAVARMALEGKTLEEIHAAFD